VSIEEAPVSVPATVSFEAAPNNLTGANYRKAKGSDAPFAPAQVRGPVLAHAPWSWK